MAGPHDGRAALMAGPRGEAPNPGKLRWRCRRGMQELDILLSRYVDERFAAASSEEQEAFQRLLDSQDTLIYSYCFGHRRPPEELVALIGRITANATVDQ